MGFAILHIEKGTVAKAGGLGNHIDRRKNVPNADPALSHNNTFVYQSEGKLHFCNNFKNRSSLQERINNRIKEGYTKPTPIRKNAVTHLNIILTGSHKEMKEIESDPKKLESWMIENFNFASEKFGSENIVDFTLHVDERTPHIHCVVVPLTKDGRLSAKEVMGDRRKMSQRQTDYGTKMQQLFGLERGIKGSQATHDSIQEYYGRIDNRLQQVRTYGVKVPEELSVDMPKVTPPGLFENKDKWARKQNKTIRETIERGMKKLQENFKKSNEEQINDLSGKNLVLHENNKELRQQNCQLRGKIKEQEDEKLGIVEKGGRSL